MKRNETLCDDPSYLPPSPEKLMPHLFLDQIWSLSKAKMFKIAFDHVAQNKGLSK